MRLTQEQINQVERERIRRDAIYEVETFLEENQVALFRWDHRGGEKVLGEEVGVGIIRRLLEV